jgi:iron complex outermembrane receptor protein
MQKQAKGDSGMQQFKTAPITRHLTVPGAIALLSSLPIVPLQAQETAFVLEEVLVTARKREETLQEAPLAVSVLSGEQLAREGLRDLTDLQRVVPNIDVDIGTDTQIYIRGVGARNGRINYDSGVGVYVDGAYVSRQQGGNLVNVDLANVQVLRGPQGGLFGKNTTGGAIIYTTNRPTEEFEGNAEMRVGNFGRQDFKGTINVPLVDGLLASRFSIWSQERDGYVSNHFNGDELNDENRQGGQAQLSWTPSDTFTANFNLHYTEVDQSGQGVDCNPSEVPGSGFQATLMAPLIVHATGKTIAEHCAENGALGEDDVLNDYVSSETESETLQGIVTLNWELGDGYALKSTSAWRDIESSGNTEIDAIGIPFLSLHQPGVNDRGTPVDAEIFTQELQFSGSALDDRLSFMVGAFYFEEQATLATFGGQGPLFADTLPGVPFPLPGGSFLFYAPGVTDSETDNESTAVYAQFDWSFNDSWTLSAGLRYTDETRELYRKSWVPDTSVADPPATPLGGAIGEAQSGWLLPGGEGSFVLNHGWVDSNDPNNDQTQSVESDDWTPMVSLRYSFDDYGWIDSGGAYFTYSEGFLSGGVSENLNFITGKLDSFDPEQVTNYEFGVKLSGLDDRLTINTALFYMDYEDRQLTSVKFNPDSGLPQAAVINAEASSIFGLEVETVWLPLPNLQLTANVSWNDGDIETFDDTRIVVGGTGEELGLDCVALDGGLDVCDVDRSDEDLPRLAKYSYYLSAQMLFQLGDGTLVPQVSYSYRDSVEYCQDRGSCVSGTYQQDRKDLAASLTWSNDTWRVRLWGQNLTDERYIAGGQFITDVMGTEAGKYNLPRTYGLDVSVSF